MRLRSWPWWAVVATLALVYFATAKLGLRLAFVADQVTAVWPPTGIALAAILLLGIRVWPGIALGAFLANVFTQEPVGTACGIAAGNTLEAVVGAWLLRRAGFLPALARVKDVLGLVILAAFVSTMVSATMGVLSLCLGGVTPWSSLAPLWWVWWLGDALSDLVIAPVLLTWVVTPPTLRNTRKVLEAGLLATALAVVCLVVFAGQLTPLTIDHPLEYTIFPFVIWAALRYGQPGTATITLLASSIAIWGTVHASGPFSKGEVHESLILLQSFMGVVAVTGLVLAATATEQQTAVRRRDVEYAVTQILAESTSIQRVTPKILQAIGQSLHWKLGALWTVDAPAQRLRCVEIWHQPRMRAVEFVAMTRQHTFASGIGLPGRVWERREPVWIRDVVTDPNFPRAHVAAQEDLHGAFGFPILLGGDVLGVIEFFSQEIQEPDEPLLAMLATLGSQIGQFLERKRAEESLRASEERLRLALDAGRMGVWDWNVKTNALKWSDHLEPMHGLAPGTFGGTFGAFQKLVHPDDRPGVAEAIRQAFETQTDFEVEFRNVWSDGSVHWIAGKGRVYLDERGEAVRMIGVGLDVTERKSLAEQLRQRAEQLAEADRRKDEFLAMLAHELRNPLAPLRNALQVLKLQGPPDPLLEQMRDMMERQVRNMSRLVDDLLDIARITRHKIELHKEKVDLGAIVPRAVETARPFLDARGHQLEVVLPAGPMRLEADPTRLEQILANLLNNAAKYTEPGGRIWLSAEREGIDILLRVRDNGIGIRPEMLPRVFDLFTQADHVPDRAQEGLGIGLTLVRSLVLMHGGSVAVASAGPGQGSEFVVRLPALPDGAATPSRPASPQTSPGDQMLHLLLVDDNVDAAESLALVLRIWGHEVRLAHDGPSALEAARTYRPDVVLLDIGLPGGMDGYEVGRRLRQEVGLSEALLIALTGYGQAEDRRRSHEAGFDHHLVKPVDPEELMQLLSSSGTRRSAPE